jgi:hypothetical protein
MRQGISSAGDPLPKCVEAPGGALGAWNVLRLSGEKTSQPTWSPSPKPEQDKDRRRAADKRREWEAVKRVAIDLLE